MSVSAVARSPGSLAVLSAAVVLAVLVGLSAWAGVASPGPRTLEARAPLGSALGDGPATPEVAPAIHIIIPHPTWVNVTSAAPHAAPPGAAGVASAYDPASHTTVAFGGCLAHGPCPDNQTWLFSNGTWANVTAHRDDPPVREYAALDYDANMHGMLLFGGQGAKGVMLNDTWLYRGGVWTNVSAYSAAPPAGEGAAMAFDPQPEENGSVLFGGCVIELFFLVCSNETWVWQGGAGWVELTVSVAPPPRGFTALAYDPVQGDLVMFGGADLLTVWDDTWELYSGQWWNVTPAASPPGIAQGGMVDDPGLPGLVLFGGFNSAGLYQAETWSFDAGVWGEESPTSSPPAIGGFGLALDGTGTTPILVAGTNGTDDYNATWAYEFPPAGTMDVSTGATEVQANVTFTVLPVDGTPPFTAAVDFGDGSQGYASGPGPSLVLTHAYDAVGSYTVSANVTDAVGARAAVAGPTVTVAAGPLVDVSASPSAGDVGVPIAFTGTLLSGGSAPLNYTWSFGDGGAPAYGPAVEHAFAASGSYEVRLTTTDADGAVATARVEVPVAAAPTVELAVDPSNPRPGASVGFFANTTGGEGPFNFSWVFAKGLSSSLAYPVESFASAGSYTVQVWANDSAHGSAHASVVVHVSAPAAPLFGDLAHAPAWFWGGIGAVAAAGAAGSFALVRRGRAPKA